MQVSHCWDLAAHSRSLETINPDKLGIREGSYSQFNPNTTDLRNSAKLEFCLTGGFLSQFLLRAALLGPSNQKKVWHYYNFMAGVTKIGNFVYSSIYLVPVNQLLRTKKVEILKKWKKYSSNTKGSLWEKNWENCKNISLPKKVTFFFTWIWTMATLNHYYIP